MHHLQNMVKQSAVKWRMLIFLSSQMDVCKLVLSVMAFGGGAFTRWIGFHEVMGWGPHRGIRALMRRWELALPTRILYLNLPKRCSRASPTLNMLRALAVGLNHRTPGLFYNKVLTVSCNWSNTLLKVKTSGCMSAELLWVYWFVHAGGGVTGSGHLSCLTRGEAPHIASPGKDSNSKFEVRFLLKTCHLRIIVKSKKSNHCQVRNCPYI